MRKQSRTVGQFLLMLGVLASAVFLNAQEVPADYQQVLKIVGKSGDYKQNVLKVNVPRNDQHITIADYPVPTPFGFGGWFALTKGDDGTDVMMGDLVLLEDEVNPVMSALLDHGLEVTALHNHFFWDKPRVFFMHVHGHGKAVDLASQIKPALDLIGHATPALSAPAKTNLDTAAIAKIVGHEGEQNGAVYKITLGRDDLTVKEMGATTSCRDSRRSERHYCGSTFPVFLEGWCFRLWQRVGNCSVLVRWSCNQVSVAHGMPVRRRRCGRNDHSRPGCYNGGFHRVFGRWADRRSGRSLGSFCAPLFHRSVRSTVLSSLCAKPTGQSLRSRRHCGSGGRDRRSGVHPGPAIPD